jgi:nucleotide-binding universal stress UspA family protein
MSGGGGPVLIGFDGSDAATQAVRRGGRLLTPRVATVACVWEPFAQLVLHTDVLGITAPMRAFEAEFDAEARAQATVAATAGAAIAEEVGLRARIATAPAAPKAWSTLLELADELDAAALLIGSRGLGATKGAIVGSVASGVLHHSSRPVVVVPPEQGAEVPEGPLVMAYDGSEDAQRAIVAAGRLFPGRDAVVRTVWTSFAGVAAASQVAIPAGVGAVGRERIDDDLRGRAEDMAEEGADLAVEAGLHATGAAVCADANVCNTLLESARHNGVAAIVVGARGRSVIADILLGSVSSGLVRRSPVPVLVVPPPR